MRTRPKAAAIAVVVVVALGGLLALIPFDTSEGEGEETIDVFMIAGQSNAAYTFRAVPSEANPICPKGVAYYFGDDVSPVTYDNWDGDAEYGIHDMVNADGTAHIGGLEQGFAATYYKLTGHKICIINTAVSGSKIIEWYPSTGYCYVWAQEVFTKAMSKISETYNPDVKGLIWLQGESNPTWQVQAYKNRFMTMFNTMDHTSESPYFNDDYAFEDCIISLTRQHRGMNSCIAQIELDAEQTKVKLGCIVCDHFTYENGLLYNDDTHYTQKGRNIVAVDLANNYVKHLAIDD